MSPATDMAAEAIERAKALLGADCASLAAVELRKALEALETIQDGPCRHCGGTGLDDDARCEFCCGSGRNASIAERRATP